MKLNWNLFENPVYNSASPWFRGLNKFQLTDATFSTYAFGGFGDATLTLDRVPPQLIEEIWRDWFMKRVTATDASGAIAYEGYVAEINVQYGSINDMRSIDAFFNRAFVEYTTGATGGGTAYGRVQRNETDVDASAETQTRWGIKEEWVDKTGDGIISSTVAQAAGDIVLADAIRARHASWNLGDLTKRGLPQNVSVTLTCWGFHSTLQWRKQSVKYTTATAIETIVSGALTTGSKAQYIDTSATALANLTATGRSIQYNTNATPAWMSDYIADVISNGNSAGKRLTFAIWENRVPYLEVRSTSPKYFLNANDHRAFDLNHAVLPLYLVRAGGYAVHEDALENTTIESDVLSRPRAQFVSQTTYDDIAETLTIPPPEVEDDTRLLARARRRARGQRG